MTLSLPDVIGAEARRKVSAGYCTANVFAESALRDHVSVRAEVDHLPARRRQRTTELRHD
jgi:hypothetical protein